MGRCVVVVRFLYDLAISYAGEDRDRIEGIVEQLQRKKLRLFYDINRRNDLWGRNLRSELELIYGSQARFVLAFVSRYYLEKPWTLYELDVCRRRLVHDNAHLLLVVDDTATLPEDLSEVAYMDASRVSLREIVESIVSKLGIAVHTELLDVLLSSANADERVQAIRAIASFQDDDRFGEVLTKCLQTDHSPEVRAAAAWALDRLRLEMAIPYLLQALQDSYWSVRSNAGWALVRFGAKGEKAVAEHLPVLRTGEAQEMAQLILDRIHSAAREPTT